MNELERRAEKIRKKMQKGEKFLETARIEKLALDRVVTKMNIKLVKLYKELKVIERNLSDG